MTTKIEIQKGNCKICHKSLNSVSSSHLKTHGITVREYDVLFGANGAPYTQCSFVTQNLAKEYDFKHHQCKLSCLPNSNLCILHELSENKDQEAFNKSFYTLLKLYETLNSAYWLEGIIFPGDVNIVDITFKNPVYFIGCHFLGKCTIRAVFEAFADFRFCKYQDSATFTLSKFLGEANFNFCEFLKTVDFKRALFAQYAHFWMVKYNGDADFHQAKFLEEAAFGRGKFSQNSNKMIFVDTRFEQPRKILFASVDFSQALFRFTDLTEIKFRNVYWPVTSKFKGSRRYIADEVLASNTHKTKIHYTETQLYEYAQILYQQLKRNFEECRSYSEAGDFYYGEMECYRKSRKRSRYGLTWTNLYRISSGYGQRYMRAGFVLLLLIFVFSTSHMFLGLQPTGQISNNYHIIEYSINVNSFNLKSFLSDLAATTVYCAEVLTRQEEQDRLFRPLSIYGEALNVTLSLIVYVQILFFILALRRHFKR